MKWTKKLPNKKGCYWYKSGNRGLVDIVWVIRKDGILYAENEVLSFPIKDEENNEQNWCYIPEPKVRLNIF